MRKYVSVAILILSAVLFSGCASQKPVQRPPFPVDEYDRLAKTGTGKITGQFFASTVGGTVIYGAGSEVLLIPPTSYSDFWFHTNYVQSKPVSPGDSRQAAYTRSVQADGSGNFEFSSIPPGDYYILGRMTWAAPTQFGLAQQGGWLVKKITVSNESSTRLMLTNSH